MSLALFAIILGTITFFGGMFAIMYIVWKYRP